MILIGIGGDSAVGKTTASDYIRSKLPATVIHLDFILNEFKKKHFPDNIRVAMAHSGEEEVVVINHSPFDLTRYKKAYRAFLHLKTYLINLEVQKKLKQLEIEGYEIVIIEGRSLDCLSIDFSCTIHIDSSLHNRVLRHKIRDDQINRDTVIDWDIAASDKSVNLLKSYNYGICNNQDMENFEAILDKILAERFPDFNIDLKMLVPEKK